MLHKGYCVKQTCWVSWSGGLCYRKALETRGRWKPLLESQLCCHLHRHLVRVPGQRRGQRGPLSLVRGVVCASPMAAPGPYSGVSTLAFVRNLLLLLLNGFSPSLVFYPHWSAAIWRWQVARASAFTVGLVYGSFKLSYLKVTLPFPQSHLSLPAVSASRQ